MGEGYRTREEQIYDFLRYATATSTPISHQGQYALVAIALLLREMLEELRASHPTAHPEEVQDE